MKAIKFLLLALFGVIIFLPGCGPAKHDPAQVKTDLDNNNSLFAKSFNSKDITGVMTFYLDDAELLPPNYEPMKGKDNIRNFWQQGMKVYSNLDLRMDMADVEGNVTIETGRYTGTAQMPGQPTVQDTGKYMVVWKYQPDGKWKISRDMFSSNIPVPQPEKSGKKMMKK